MAIANLSPVLTSEQQPRAVVFDLGGVICRFEPERRLELLATESNLANDAVLSRLRESDFVATADCGGYTAEEEFKFASRILSLSCSYETFRSIWCSAFIIDGRLLSIARLVRRHAITAILSDNCPIISDGLNHELSRLKRYFDKIFLSWHFGATKPNQTLFEGVEQALCLKPHEILLIDDSERNIEGAHRAGWRGVLFQNSKQLVTELRRHLLL